MIDLGKLFILPSDKAPYKAAWYDDDHVVCEGGDMGARRLHTRQFVEEYGKQWDATAAVATPLLAPLTIEEIWPVIEFLSADHGVLAKNDKLEQFFESAIQARGYKMEPRVKIEHKSYVPEHKYLRAVGALRQIAENPDCANASCGVLAKDTLWALKDKPE